MVLNRFRWLSDKLSRKPVRWFAKHNVSPNTISIIGFVVTLIAAIGYAFPQVYIYNMFWAWFPVVLFFLSGWLDVMDGGVARATGKETKFGGFLDSTLDRLGDAAIILGLTVAGIIYPWDRNLNDLIGYSAMTIVIMISYTRSRAENEGVIMKGVGLMERAERVFIIMGGYIMESAFYVWTPYTSYPEYGLWFFPIFFMVFTLLCVQTLIARVLHAYRWLSGKMSRKYLVKHHLLELYNMKYGIQSAEKTQDAQQVDAAKN
jgi:archaetidylinositol phosphate synthase